MNVFRPGRDYRSNLIFDRGTDAGFIAGRHGISARYVRKLFEQEGTSFTHFLLGERLTRVSRLLRDPRHAHLTIAQIAHNSGFNDISYFNRVFRRHFDATPSDFRERARET